MEPMSREQKEAVLQNHPQASPQDIEEYERLLAARFAVDPSLPRSPAHADSEDAREGRLRELYGMLFG